VDVLLVDDIHFIAGKDATEEEFFHTFNALHNAGRQLVLSSDRPPRAMRHLHDRLRSRFEWGLLADLQSPDAAHRLEILRAKAHALGLPLAEDALAALAALDHASVREMEGALTRVAAYARMVGYTPTPGAPSASGAVALIEADLVARAVAPLRLEADRTISGTEIVELVARHFGVAPEGLRGKGRDHTTAWARQVAMYLLREETPASLAQIGQDLGGRDHTTIMHGCARVAQATAASEATRREVEALRATLHRATTL
jgi:chromosomal replication initiator protein